MLHRHPQITSFVVRLAGYALAALLLAVALPDVDLFYRLAAAVVVALVVGALVDRHLGLSGRWRPQDGPPGQH